MEFDEVNIDIENDNIINNSNDLNYIDEDIKDDDLIYQIPKFSKVIIYYGNSLSDKDWLRQRIKTDININYFDQSNALKEPYKFMSSKILESNEILNDFLDDFIYNVKEKCGQLSNKKFEDSSLSDLIKEIGDEDSFMTRFNVKTAVETYYIGRIRYGTTNGKLNYQNIYLEDSSSHGHGDVIPLDLTLFLKKESDEEDNKTRNLSIFPGQIVIVKAQNPNGNFMRVTKIIDFFNIFPSSFPSKCPKILLDKEPINIVCACGPFVSFSAEKEIDLTDVSYIKSIADYLKHYNPDVLFLFGPSLEEDNFEFVQKWALKETLTTNTTYPYQWSLERLFNYQIRALYKELEGLSVHTQIVFIPSTKELGESHIYPLYPSNTKSFRQMLSFSNPSLLTLGGITIGLNSADILLHLSRQEINNADANVIKKGERLRRLSSHVLAQKSFYPLLPPDPSINVEYTMYNHLYIPVNPHILILPSILRPFIDDVNGTIVVNPGKVSKNSIARIMIDPLKDESYYSGSLSQYINVEIVKLIKDC